MALVDDTPPLDALVIGESLIDVIGAPDGTVVERPGGSPMNVALGLSRLGHDVALVTSVGADRGGEVVRLHLAGSGVSMRVGAEPPLRTSIARATLDRDGSARYELDIIWPHVPVPVPRSSVLHTGSIALFQDPGAGDVLTILETATSTVVSVDPNIRPASLPGARQARERTEEAAGHAHVVKLSAEDAAYLYPRASTADVLQRLLDLGTALAILTDGPDGSFLATARTRVHVRAVATTVVDTVGAGDAYSAGVLHWLLAHRGGGAPPDPAQLTRDDLTALGRSGAAAAALTVGRVGADPPWLRELEHATSARPPAAPASPPHDLD